MLVALDEERLHAPVFAVGGKVGADVEGLAAAGGDRDDAVEDDVVADRPREDRKDEGDEEDGGASEAGGPPVSVAVPGARPGDSAER